MSHRLFRPSVIDYRNVVKMDIYKMILYPVRLTLTVGLMLEAQDVEA